MLLCACWLLILLAKLRAANFLFFLIFFVDILGNDCAACYYVPSGSCCLGLAMLCAVLCCHVLFYAAMCLLHDPCCLLLALLCTVAFAGPYCLVLAVLCCCVHISPCCLVLAVLCCCVHVSLLCLLLVVLCAAVGLLAPVVTWWLWY